MTTNQKFAKAVGVTVEKWESMLAESNREIRLASLREVDALLMADWKFVLPDISDSEPWQWYWRRPPRRKGSKGKLFLSTTQAFNALMREQALS